LEGESRLESYSQLIGNFAGDLKLGGVPPAVVEKAKLVFLDTLGVALASSTWISAPW
jgi:2-methylcitrate dehydratase PrpD